MKFGYTLNPCISWKFPIFCAANGTGPAAPPAFPTLAAALGEAGAVGTEGAEEPETCLGEKWGSPTRSVDVK